MCDGGTADFRPGGAPVPCDDTVPQLLLGSYRPVWDWKFNTTVRLFDNLRLFAMVEMPLDYWTFNHHISQRHSGFENAYKRFNPLTDNDPMYWAANVHGIGNNGGILSSRYRADFAKLREVSATYTLPFELTERFGVQRASVTVAGRDLWTIWVKQRYLQGERIPDPEARSASESSTGATFPQPPLSSLSVTMRVSF
jgi:hypothetical protein